MNVLKVSIISWMLAALLGCSGSRQQVAGPARNTTVGAVPTVVTYVHHDKVSATMVKGGPIIEDQGLRVLANRRGAGDVEMHAKNNHVFIIIEGEATMVVGGTMVNGQTTKTDQWRASSIEGGQTYHLTKGDVITIPSNTPHWWKEVPTGTIAYYAVNIGNL